MTAPVSVIIPADNRADLSGETVRAVLAQTLPPAEVIVVDDGSTDSTADAAAAFGARVQTLRIPNSGDLVARNVGLRAAKAPLAAFCDSDDLWMPDFLSTVVAQWDAKPQLLACYSNFRILQDGVLSTRTKFDEAPTGFWDGLDVSGPDGGSFDHPIVARLLDFQPFFPSCMVVSREAFLALGGWDEGVSRVIGCDFATALRVAAHPPVGIVRAPLVAVRKHGGNISGNTERMNLGDARVLEHVLRTRPELVSLEGALRGSIARRRRDALGSAFDRRDFAMVREIHAMLSPAMSGRRERAKRAIAALPHPLALLLASLLSR